MSNWLLPEAHKDQQSITKDWSPSQLQLIDGVVIKEVRPVLTGYGHLTEIFRREWLSDCKEVDQIFASTLQPGGISAWHAHEFTTDRLFVVSGQLRIVLYDARTQSATFGLINELKLAMQRPMLVIVPPKVWHGVQNYGSSPSILLNAVDRAYQYDSPDHWRVAANSSHIPYQFPNLQLG